MEDQETERLRTIMRQWVDTLIDRGVIASRKDWTDKAGLPESTLRNFLSKPKPGTTSHTRSMTMINYVMLARAVGIPVASLIGEEAPRDEAERLILQAVRLADEEGKRALMEHARRELRLAEGSPQPPARQSAAGAE